MGKESSGLPIQYKGRSVRIMQPKTSHTPRYTVRICTETCSVALLGSQPEATQKNPSLFLS